MIKPPVGRGALRRGGSRALAVVAAAAAAALLAPQAASAAGAGSFSPTASMPFPRHGSVAAPLPDGRVLVAGGQGNLFGQTVHLASALVFDPSTNGFSAGGIGQMGTARAGAVAAPLPDGRVLVAGGSDGGVPFHSSAEIFDPRTNTFTPTGSMSSPRFSPVAAPLPDGRILVAGGRDGGNDLSSAEVFNPATNGFSSAGSMGTAREGATAAPLPDGQVLVAGGTGLSSAEAFNPATNSFSSAGIGQLGLRQSGAAAAPLPDGRVLVAGGYDGSGPSGSQASGEVFDPATNSFSSAGIGSMATARIDAAAAPLPDGRVLVVGGRNYGITEIFATAEIFAASNGFSYRVRGKRLLVTVEASGTVEVKGEKGGSRAASARKRKKRSPLRPSSASGGPGTIAVPLRLGKAAKGKLRRKGKVRVRATITFSPQGGLANSQTAKLRIRAKSRKKDREKHR
jgi:Kelch motif